MARIEAEREMHLAAILSHVVGRVAKMVFHIASADMQFGVKVGKLTEDPLRALAHDVGQHVEPATVSHGHHYVVDVLRGGPLNGHLNQRNEALRTFQ